MRRILIFSISMSFASVSFAQKYIAFETSGVTHRGVNKYDDVIHWHPQLVFGHLYDTSTRDSNWRYGWEAGAIYLAPRENMVGELSGYGADGFFVANNNFSGGWEFFYKLGAGLERLSLDKSNLFGGGQERSTIFYGVGKLGFGYQFKNGIGLFISENFQTKPVGHPVISYDGFYTSLGITYAF